MHPVDQFKPARVAQVDVDESDIRSKLMGTPERLSAIVRHPNHRNALALEERTGIVEERRAVVDDQAAKHRQR